MRKKLVGLIKKTWFFPAALFVVVIILGLLQINGSSIGIYHELLYGDSSKDENLLLNKPRPIRSDEWLVTTQLSIAQTKNNFAPVNTNIGDGIDVSLLVDAPTSDFAQIFKPHNLAFFILPVSIAFSLKWWLLAYFLAVSVYLFVITLLPNRKLLAVLLSFSFLASPFIAWWYQYITLAPIYYTLFGLVVAIKLMQSRSVKAASLWGALLAYIAVSFALVLYPPFQIPCVLFAVAFLAGYVLDNKKTVFKNAKPITIGGGGAVILTLLFVALCLIPKLPVIEVITNTAYPGNRITESGGYNPLLFLASNTSILTQSNSRAGAFTWIPNQSEGSNFLLVFILLVPVLVFFAIKYRRKIPNFWTLCTLLLLMIVFIIWLFVPNVDLLGKITLLNRVLHARLLMGFGLINLLAVIVFVQIFEKQRFRTPTYVAALYSLLILFGYIIVNLSIANLFPDFMGERWALLLALPYPLIIYLFLRSRFNFAAAVLLIFSIASIIFIHPIYKGVDIVKDSVVSKTMNEIDPTGSRRWVTDSLQLENYAVLNGKQSLSGVYVYPDLALWEEDFPASENTKYNRYAHVHFQFDRNANEVIERKLTQPGPDQLTPVLEPCDTFLQKNNVGYILTTQEFSTEQANCAKLVRQVTVPRANIYFYKLVFSNG